jgi:autotransporter-associated beta strand protein
MDAPSTYIVGGKNLDTTYAGTIQNASALRTTAIVKTGTGTWTLTGNATHTGVTTVSNGTLRVNGTLAGSAINVWGGTLGGNGVLGSSVDIRSGARLAPGTSIGKLTVTNTLTLYAGSTTQIELGKSPTTNDVLKVTGLFTRAGNLAVTNSSGLALAAGDSFSIFDTPSATGAFSSVQLPPLNAGLAWNTNNLYSAGNLSVVALTPPVIQSATMLGNGTFRLTFTGTTGQNYEVRASTDVALLPITNWQLLISGMFTGNVVTLDDLAATNYPRRFYLIRVP